MSIRRCAALALMVFSFPIGAGCAATTARARDVAGDADSAAIIAKFDAKLAEIKRDFEQSNESKVTGEENRITNKTYGDGDVWPLRCISLCSGLANLILAWKLGNSRPMEKA